MSENKKIAIGIAVIFLSAACLLVSMWWQGKREENRVLKETESDLRRQEWADDIMSWYRPSNE